MQQSAGKSNNTFAGKDRHLVGQRLCRFLRSVHPAKTAERVAADTGVPVATVARWMEREGSPSAPALLRLASVYGTEVLHAVAPELPWLAVAVKVTRAATLRGALAQVETEIADTMGRIRRRP